MTKLDKNTVVAALSEWNFWERDQDVGIWREGYINKILERLESGQIVCVSGVRRSGKSFILRQTAKRLIEGGADRRRVLYVNFEDVRLGLRTAQELEAMYQAVMEALGIEGQPVWLLLDEIQEVEGWERWVRMVQELGKASVVVSGSNSRLLGRELGIKLTGRHADVVVYPLSLGEFVSFRGGREAAMHLTTFLEQGGFPLPVLAPSIATDLLLTYFSDTLTRDIAGRFRVRKEAELVDLAKFVVGNYAAPVTFTSLGKFLHVATDSVQTYLRYLQEAYLVFLVERFSLKPKVRSKSPRKVYCVDTGLANVVGLRANQNIGRLAENAVYLEFLRRGKTVYYWKDDVHREVDFIVWNGRTVDDVVQVCWDVGRPATRDREVRSILRACRELGQKTATVLTGDYEADETREGVDLRYRRLAAWLTQGDVEKLK